MIKDFNSLLIELRQTNLCTFYLLPLTGFTRSSFGDGLFINSYLDVRKRWIIVQVADLDLIHGQSTLRIHAVKSWNNEKGGFLAYKLYRGWDDDIQAYCRGAYSRFSVDLKNIIFERSGLDYQKKVAGGLYTDFRLLALDGKQVLRAFIEEELGITLDTDQEVLGIPTPDSFMDVTEM